MTHLEAAVIIGVDPGTHKCGIAAVSHSGVLVRQICQTERLVVAVLDVHRKCPANLIVIGDGTNGRKLAQALRDHPGLPPVEVVGEQFSTLEARSHYFEANPPRGLRRFIPRGLLVPREPIDDYVAALLASRHLSKLLGGADHQHG